MTVTTRWWTSDIKSRNMLYTFVTPSLPKLRSAKNSTFFAKIILRFFALQKSPAYDIQGIASVTNIWNYNRHQNQNCFKVTRTFSWFFLGNQIIFQKTIFIFRFCYPRLLIWLYQTRLRYNLLKMVYMIYNIHDWSYLNLTSSQVLIEQFRKVFGYVTMPFLPRSI